MTLGYSPAFRPAAPVATLMVRSAGGIDGRPIAGLLDTGADLCALPALLVAELDLRPVRTVRVAGFEGQLREVRVFLADLDVAGTTHLRVEVVESRRAHAIVGRNVLNELKVTLDGPRGAITVARRRRGRR